MLAASRCCHSRLLSAALLSLRCHVSVFQTHIKRSPLHHNTTSQRRHGAKGAAGDDRQVKWRRKVEFSTGASPSSASSSSSLSTMRENREDGSFVNVDIRCRQHEADVLSEALLCYGASSASMDELSDCEDDDEICISVIFTNHEDAHRCISLAADSIGLEKAPSYEIRAGDQYNWLNTTKESFHPTEVANGLWIVPEWKTPPESIPQRSYVYSC